MAINKKHGGAAAAVAAAVVAVAALFGIHPSHAPLKESTAPGSLSFRPSQAYEIPATQDIKFRVVPTNRMSEGPGAAQSLSDALAKDRKLLGNHLGKGFQIRSIVSGGSIPNADLWGPVRNLGPTLDRVSDILSSSEVGSALLIRAVVDDYRLRDSKADLNPAMVIDTEGTRPIDIVVGTTITAFPKVLDWGIYVCKNIEGTSTPSQHSYANAVDWGGDVAYLDKVAHYLYGLTLKGYIPVSQILWKNENMLSGNYVYDHTNHIHVSGDPLLSGSCRLP